MKKIILSVSVIYITFSSCVKSEDLTTTPNSKITSFSKNTNSENAKQIGKEYMSQLPYIRTIGNEDVATFNAENDINIKLANDDFTWQNMHDLYNGDLNSAEKQNLAYLVLAKKDLLGDYNDNPNAYEAAIVKNYTDILVDSRYIGLYYSPMIGQKNSQFKI